MAKYFGVWHRNFVKNFKASESQSLFADENAEPWKPRVSILQEMWPHVVFRVPLERVPAWLICTASLWDRRAPLAWAGLRSRRNRMFSDPHPQPQPHPMCLPMIYSLVLHAADQGRFHPLVTSDNLANLTSHSCLPVSDLETFHRASGEEFVFKHAQDVTGGSINPASKSGPGNTMDLLQVSMF